MIGGFDPGRPRIFDQSNTFLHHSNAGNVKIDLAKVARIQLGADKATVMDTA
jgi:hypothetical protein